tara:strand:+ start:221 stop:619 length:399 start_codon:yes stop_codon:yes gene_type:complete
MAIDTKKMTDAAVDTALKNSAELFKGDKALLSIAAGVIANSACDILGRGVRAIIHSTLKAASKSESEEAFNKEMRKRLTKSKEMERMHGAVRFLADFANDVALTAASDTINAMKNEGKDPLDAFASENFQRN